MGILSQDGGQRASVSSAGLGPVLQGPAAQQLQEAVDLVRVAPEAGQQEVEVEEAGLLVAPREIGGSALPEVVRVPEAGLVGSGGVKLGGRGREGHGGNWSHFGSDTEAVPYCQLWRV